MDNQQERFLEMGFKKIPEFSRYMVNAEADIVSLAKTKPIFRKRPKPDTSTYIRIGLIDDFGIERKQLLHRIVFFSFNPDVDPSLEVNHLDGNKLNNHLSNLEAVTRSENLTHAYQIGLRSSSGLSNPRNVLTEERVMCIYRELLEGESCYSIGKKYGVNSGSIHKIKTKTN